MPLHASFDIYVEVDGTRLEEYDIAFDAAAPMPTISCWVPSQSGKTFSIRCENLNLPRYATVYLFDIDGVRVDTRINRADHGPLAQIGSKCKLANIRAAGGRHELAFAELELTDESDDEAIDRRPNASLGEIRVQIQPAIVTEDLKPTRRAAGVSLSTGKVHERSKKAGEHSIELGPASRVKQSRTVMCKDIGPPIMAFVFRYQPLALLQAQGIAPPPTPSSSPSPSPGPGTPSSDLEFLDADGAVYSDDEEDISRLHEQVAIAQRRKRGAGPKVKNQPPPQRRRISDASDDDVIDLTSD